MNNFYEKKKTKKKKIIFFWKVNEIFLWSLNRMVFNYFSSLHRANKSSRLIHERLLVIPLNNNSPGRSNLMN